MKNAYIYPISARVNKDIFNPYLNNFMDSLRDEFLFLNRNKPSDIGLFDIIRYTGRIKYVFFHWPENIAERKYGLLQSLFLLVMLTVFKFKKIRIVYVVHNKISHSKRRNKLKKLIAKSIARSSTGLITHSGDGVTFIKSLIKKEKIIFYFPHPVIDERPIREEKKDIDILIWGNIAPYKGIHNFFELINEKDELSEYKIIIAGKVSSAAYLKELNKYASGNTEIIDQFIEDEQLNEFISRSKIILFPYHPDTVLSSGAFAKSIAHPVSIIGPDCGSFRDFSSLENVDVFQDINEMVYLLKSRLLSYGNQKMIMTDHIADKYSWRKFGSEFISFMVKNFPG